MSITFKTIADLEKYTMEQNKQALEKVANEVFIKWKGLIKKRVYEEGRLKKHPDNEYYKRTSQLLDSFEVEWVNETTIGIGYNTDKIYPSMMLDRHSFNRHTSFDGVDWSNAIPYFVEIGNGDSKIYSYEGVNAFEDICEMLEQSFAIMFKKALNGSLPIK